MATDPVINAKGETGTKIPGKWVESKTVVYGVTIFAIFVLIIIGIGLYMSGGKFLLQLQDTAVSRGLITFLVAIVTVSIALVIAVWVIASNADTDTIKARFSLVKDILATLVGILGTVLGFYFGSVDKPVAEQLIVAELQFKSGQLVTHISGGTAPYRYTVTPSEVDPKKTPRISKDGWIFEPVPVALKAGSTVTIEVVDSKDRKTSRTLKYQDEERETSTVTTAPTSHSTQGAGQGSVQKQLPAKPASK